MFPLHTMKSIQAILALFLMGNPLSATNEAQNFSEMEINSLLAPMAEPQVSPPDLPNPRDIFLKKDYLEFSELDAPPYEQIRWDEDSGKILVVPTGSLPYVTLKGTLCSGCELSIDDRWVPAKPDGRFQFDLRLPKAPKVFRFRVFRSDRSFVTYRIIHHWIKLPPSIHVKVREGASVSERSVGYSEQSEMAGQAQLYSGGTPISVVDLDSQKHSQLAFRLYAPPDTEINYDRWAFTVTTSRGEIIGELSRLGTAPSFIDWREISEKIVAKDTYYYQLNLINGETTYKGARNAFETVEGLSLLTRSYLPTIALEPKYEVGYLDFQNLRGVQFSNLYIGADLPIVFQNRYILRGTANTSLHNVDPTNNLTYTRIGAGFRFFGQGENDLLGHPHIYRFDVLVNHAAYTIYPGANITRFAQVSLLLEPQFALWAYNYIVPTFEYGTRSALDVQRISLGLSYYFFVRPWSLRIGLGVQYEKLFDFHPPEVGFAESLRFQVFRTNASIVLAL